MSNVLDKVKIAGRKNIKGTRVLHTQSMKFSKNVGNYVNL